MKVAGWILLGVGALAFVFGLVVGLAAEMPPGLDTPEGQELSATAQYFALPGLLAAVLGGGMLLRSSGQANNLG